MKKRIIAFVCVLALLLSTPIASVEAASSSDTYKVGFSKVDITPEVDSTGSGIPMNGYSDQESRKALGVLTPGILRTSLQNNSESTIRNQASELRNVTDPNMFHLYASCVAITDQAGTTMLMLSLDVNGCPESRSAAMRRAISNATGVPEENITITATHTHSAPDLSYTTYDQVAEYVAKLDKLVVSCAEEAMANRSDATMWQNTVTVENMNFVRHYYTSYAGSNALEDDAKERHVTGSNFGSQYGVAVESVAEADDSMHLLMFKFTNNNKKDIVLCNWRAHPCNDSSTSMRPDHKNTANDSYYYFSSDYIGPMRTALEKDYDLLFLQGAAGNIASASSANKNTQLSSYAYGTALARELRNGINGMEQLATGSIQTSRTNMPVEYIQYSPEDVAYAQLVDAVYDDLYENGKITDPNSLLTEQSTYTKKTTDRPNGYEVSIWSGSSDTYQGALASDGKVTQDEAHRIAGYLAWAGGYGSRHHINNIIKNANRYGSDTLQLNAITLGSEIAFVTAPVELFDTYTADLKDYNGTPTFVVGYTNGEKGYLPDEKAFFYNATEISEGNYVYGGSYEVHTTDYAMGTGEKVAQAMKNMLDSMKTPRSCPCVGTHTDKGDCQEIVWKPWTETASLPYSGNYYLTKDVEVPVSTELQGILNLDLNGKTVRGANGIFTMAKDDHLVVTDSYKNGQLGTSGVPIAANAGSKLTVYAGTIGGTIQNKGASVTLWGTPSMYINMAKNAPAMDCRGLQTGANVYVVGAFDQRFAKVSSADQRECFRVQNDYNTRYDSGYLYLTSKEIHCVCAGSLSGGAHNHTCNNTLEWQRWTDTTSLPTESGNYYLTDNVYLTAQMDIEPNATVCLDLNGKTVYVGQKLNEKNERVPSETGIRALYIPNGSTLELTNSNPNRAGTLDGSACAPTTRDSYGGVIYADTDSTLNLYSNITISGNRSGSKKTATAVRGGCVYSLGAMTMYGGTITDGSVSGTGRRGGNVYTSGTFAMYGGTITNGAGSGINLYIDGQANATIGGTSYIYSGIVVGDYAALTLTGSPHIPDWTKNGIVGISFYSNTPIDATGLDTQAMAQTAPNGDAVHCISIKVSDNTSAFATVSTPAQASFFKSFDEKHGVHCDAAGNVSLYNSATGTRYGCICGGKLAGSKNHTSCTLIEWEAWTDTESLPRSGNYYLTKDVNVTSSTALNGNLNLDLNGMTVTATGGSVYTVGSGQTLQITDSGSNGTINATNGTSNGGVINATGSNAKYAFVNLYGGTITGTATRYGGGIYLERTDFTMYGGTITDCSAHRGGSIYVNTYSTATIKGGTVENGTVRLSGSTNSLGGNISVHGSSTLNVEGGLIAGGAAFGNNGNGGNINVYATANIKGGTIKSGKARNLGDNIYVGGSGKLNVSGGEICDPAEDHNIGLWGESGAAVVLTGGKIYGGDYGIYNGSDGGKTTLGGNVSISGNSSGIYMNDHYENTGTKDAPVYEVKKHNDENKTPVTVSELTINSDFTGTADVYWAGVTAEALGIAEGQEIKHTTATNYANTGTLICSNLNAHLIRSGSKLVVATVGIADGDNIVSLHTDLTDALNAYNWQGDNTNDRQFIQLYTDQTDPVNIEKNIYLDLNGHDMSVGSVDDGCKIYGMDSVTNQYTRYSANGTDLCGRLTLSENVNENCIKLDGVSVRLTMGTTLGTRTYVALKENGAYTFHRYFLALTEVGLRPTNAGIFYNAVFYGDEAVAAAVNTEGNDYGVEVSLDPEFKEYTDRSYYKRDLDDGDFKEGVLGNTGFRTVMTGIIDAETGADYSDKIVHGRAYIQVGDTMLYSPSSGSASLYSIVKEADAACANNAFSTAQRAALDQMYTNYRSFLQNWGLVNIGTPEISFGDLFIDDPKDDKALNILLIGNSFSYYWVDELYELLSEGVGRLYNEINITNVYSSGCSLQKHWNWKETGATYEEIWVTTEVGGERTRRLSEAKTLEDVITGDYRKPWDFISLQQNSDAFYKSNNNVVGDLNYARESLEPYLGNLLSYLRSYHPKAEYMWHQFWAHEVGNGNTDKTVSTVAEQTAFHNALVAIGSEVSQLYGLTIVPTGKAWAAARADNRAGSLLPTGGLCARNGYNKFDGVNDDSGDGYHDGDIGGGQLLNAYVWYMTITGDTNLSNSIYTPTYTLDDNLIAMLKDAAMSVFATE